MTDERVRNTITFPKPLWDALCEEADRRFLKPTQMLWLILGERYEVHKGPEDDSGEVPMTGTG